MSCCAGTPAFYIGCEAICIPERYKRTVVLQLCGSGVAERKAPAFKNKAALLLKESRENLPDERQNPTAEKERCGHNSPAFDRDLEVEIR